MRFELEETPLADLSIVKPKPIVDARRAFARLYCDDDFSALGLFGRVRQVNHSLTRERGAIRGMHFQHPPYGEAKLVTCLRGEVFDVAVDIRRASPTFLKWHAVRLSQENRLSLHIPFGFAHGFQTLSEDCELLYFHSAPYNAAAEGALNAFDPRIAIAWPLPPSTISERDRSHAYVNEAFGGVQS